MVKLRTRHGPLELGRANDLPEERVGGQQHVVVEENVVDAHHALFAQHDVGFRRIPAMHGEPEAEVRVVIEVRACRDDPVNESRLDERNQATHAEAGRGERAGERHAHGHVGLQHLAGEQLARLAQPAGVIRLERALDQLDHRLRAIDAARVDLASAQEPVRARARVRRTLRLAFFRDALLRAFGPGRGGPCAAVSRCFEAAAIALFR